MLSFQGGMLLYNQILEGKMTTSVFLHLQLCMYVIFIKPYDQKLYEIAFQIDIYQIFIKLKLTTAQSSPRRELYLISAVIFLMT